MSQLICPHCGAYTAFNPVYIKGRGIIKKASNSSKTIYDEVSIHSVISANFSGKGYAIIDCLACEERFVAETASSFGDIDEADQLDWSVVYPIRHITVASEIPQPIKEVFEEASLCFSVGAYKGCLLMCRTALVALQREQNVTGLQQLKDNGSISLRLHNQADEIRLWANMIAHEDVPDPVSEEDCKELLTYMEMLLESIYVQPKRLEALTTQRKKLKNSN